MAYLHLELKAVPLDRHTAMIARLTQLHGLMSQAPGFVDAQISRYLGNPTQYLITRTWADAAVHAAYRQSDVQKAFAANPAVGLWQNLLVQEWEDVQAAPGSSSGGFVVRSLYQLPDGGWEGFLATRRGFDRAALASGGVQHLKTYRRLDRSGDGAHEALLLRRWTGRAAYDAYLEHADRAAAVAAAGPDAVQPTVTECYELVLEHLPAS